MRNSIATNLCTAAPDPLRRRESGVKRSSAPPPRYYYLQVWVVHVRGKTVRDGNTALTKSENDGVDDEHSHHKTAESVVQDKPLDASPPGAADAATRRYNGHDLAKEGDIQGRQGGVRFTLEFLSAQVATYAKASLPRSSG